MRISMVAAVVEGAIGDEDVGGRRSLVPSALLRSQHYQRQLPRRLPYLLLLDDLFSIGGPVFGALVVSGLWLLYVVDFVAVVMGTTVHCFVFILTLSNGSVGHDIEPSLCLGH